MPFSFLQVSNTIRSLHIMSGAVYRSHTCDGQSMRIPAIGGVDSIMGDTCTWLVPMG